MKFPKNILLTLYSKKQNLNLFFSKLFLQNAFARGPLGTLVLSPSPTGIFWHQIFLQVRPVSYQILPRRHDDSVLFTELLPLECQHVQKSGKK